MLKIKFISRLAIVFAISATIFSCSDDSSNIEPNSKISVQKQGSTIINDQIFLDFVSTEYNFFKNIKDVAVIEAAVADDKISQQEADYMPIAMGFSDESSFTAYSDTQTKRLQYLDQKYSFMSLSDGERQELILDGLVKVNLPPSVVVPGEGDPQYTTLSCQSDFNLCFAASVVAGASAHAGCFFADAASAGLAAWLCHSGAVLLQSTMSGLCNSEYEDCINGN